MFKEKNVVNNVDRFSLRAPLQKGPEKNIAQHKQSQDKKTLQTEEEQ